MIAERLAAVRARVADACAQAGRDPGEVGLIAVSKTRPAALLLEAREAGQVDFGESYAQELRDKGPVVPGARWHFIGRIQRNKAKYIAPHAYRVHALESVAHAQALAARAPRELGCLVAVNVGGEASKGGVAPSEVLDRCEALSAVDGIALKGLMCIPPWRDAPEDCGPFFEELACLAAEGRRRGLPLTELSMGMSHDYPVAIRHGATWVRVGTAIFGVRS